MKNILAALFLLITGPAVFAQSATSNACNKSFYKSYEDYKNGVAVEGVSVVRQEYSIIYFTQNGTEQRVGPNKLPYQWFCNQSGTLMRVVENRMYYVLADGAVCLYIEADENTVSKRIPRGDYQISNAYVGRYPAEFYSLTANGKIEKLKMKTFNTILEKYSLKSQFEEDTEYKKIYGDGPFDILNKESNKILKFINMINLYYPQ